ncbi:hypothetical protein GTP41_24770 [Pseudoduganella sp. DS3]|uniref:Uncharacterized protein n=1 Tax=Pseudoduganella guangdongensis TaxID=2692179 RepID=A0A6N9HR70_9BURK|nr:hypothetical protein [Pseudoduganella guangdongensis]MYN05315.1 hypothetical protein [Pseudoduganella guangdongensis]
MSFLKSVTPTLLACVITTGCTGLPYDPRTNNDSSPPDIGLHIEGQRPDSVYKPNPSPTDTQCFPKQSDFCPNLRITPVDIGARVLGTPTVSIRIHENGEASVLATAKDSGSGVRKIRLSCNRQVYYNWDAANQTESNAVFPADAIEQTNQISNGRVPESGILQKVLNMHGQMVFQNAAGTPTRGHRVAIRCSAEASNFNGFSVQSDGVVIWAQDRSIQP